MNVPKRKSIAMQIAEHFGWDISDLRDYEYHPGKWSRKVYSGWSGNTYWSAGGSTPPRYLGRDGGLTWVLVPSAFPGNPPLWMAKGDGVQS